MVDREVAADIRNIKVWHDVGLPIGRRPEGGGKLPCGCLGEESSKDAASRLFPTFP